MKVKDAVIAAIALIVAIAGIVATPLLIESKHPELAIYGGAATGFIGLILLLELKISRFAKGMCLVGFGVLFQIMYTEYYFLFIEKDTQLYNDLKLQLSLYTQLISLACAGAGGSIVAAYADTNTTDYHVQSATQTPNDNTQKINELIASTIKLDKKLNLILTFFSLTLATTLIILLFWVLK
jgi:Ca2+/Na+ antiporter